MVKTSFWPPLEAVSELRKNNAPSHSINVTIYYSFLNFSCSPFRWSLPIGQEGVPPSPMNKKKRDQVEKVV
jgi:hypothetical protein